MTQSLQTITSESKRQEYETRLLQFTKLENLQKRFLMGEVKSKDEFLHTFLMYDKMDPKGCEVYNYIHDKIKGKLEPTKVKTSDFYSCIVVYKEEVDKECDDVVGHCAPKIQW